MGRAKAASWNGPTWGNMQKCIKRSSLGKDYLLPLLLWFASQGHLLVELCLHYMPLPHQEIFDQLLAFPLLQGSSTASHKGCVWLSQQFHPSSPCLLSHIIYDICKLKRYVWENIMRNPQGIKICMLFRQKKDSQRKLSITG